MRAPQSSEPLSDRTRQRTALAVSIGLLLLLGISFALAWKSRSRRPGVVKDEHHAWTYTGPYRNVDPEVGYVGDVACSHCHVEQAAAYHRHPMGRSLAPVTAMTDVERYGPEASNPFSKHGFQFNIERDRGRMFHTARRLDAEGRTITQWKREVSYVIGSGSSGRSYVINQNGFLTQSPISWYAQQGAWDLSPGYADDHPAALPIGPGCLVCHCNDAEAVARTVNRFRAPIFGQHAIGCERCHGPGALHVEARERGDVVAGIDTTIVNPRHLDPDLREAVCQQCHLQGETRVLRRGRDLYDYRPGLPLHQVWSVFLRRSATDGGGKAVGQVEQMYASRCFRESGGRMGCTSCHDPHQRPPRAERLAAHRGRCLSCHEDQSCSLPRAARLEKDSADNCVACHMPRRASSDMAHTAITDHRIPRRPDDGAAHSHPIETLLPGENPLVHFHQHLLKGDDPETARDVALALVALARKNPDASSLLAPLALRRLEGPVQARPEDLPAQEGLGYALWQGRRLAEALDVFERTLAAEPDRETTLIDAAAVAEQLGLADRAVAYWQRAVAVNPYSASYHSRLARLLAERRDWSPAVVACDAALRLEPFNVDVRLLLVTCLGRDGQRERAKSEFDTVLALSPTKRDVLQRWFQDQLR